MRRVTKAALLLLLTAAVSSCDFFRALAGRPGSAEIREKKARIELSDSLRRAAIAAREDSVARVRRFEVDSLYASDTLIHAGRLRNSYSIKSLPASSVPARYCVVVGAFSNPQYAEKHLGRYVADGFEGGILRYRNGLNTVFVAPCNDIVSALEELRAVKRMPYSPKETWILVHDGK